MLVIAALSGVRAQKQAVGEDFEIAALARDPKMLPLAESFGATSTYSVASGGADLDDESFDVVVDTSTGWGVPLARVSKGKPVRIQATGSYIFQASLQVGPTGFSVADPTKTDLAGDVRCGALMGLVVANGKPGKPFAVGGGRNFTPRNDGLLYLRVNAPAGSKCTGRISVRLGGNVAQN